ncbi:MULTISPECIES: DNA-directed RNA polymerase subunit beta [Nocardia]|uniref:DNA-directed RNA polymerase subunit beta n=1 Tax=Nocardia TaxID=1817 RepID=UPI00237EE28D|nr:MULTISPECIES: DNA-directed RNA polymerase subunit beta [Nocardia]MDE1672207.1 DNA-directed RNA polymerase subunit beta [Nocardia gipuzkoensis]
MSAWGFDLTTPHGQCAFYKMVCQLPAEVEPEALGRIVVRAGSMVWGVSVPEPLGRAVTDRLRSGGHSLGPTISHPHSRTWTFLVRPDLPDEPRIFAGLFRDRVKVIRDGGLIALPSPADRNAGYRTWLEAPRDTYRPSGRLVVEALRACLLARAVRTSR